jgi:prepilin-type N-terminal cleavage/methylation domain-containing protein
VRWHDQFRASERGRWGFSLPELLVVVAIISLLLSILAPAVHKARRHANRLLSTNNLRQIVQAVTLYSVDNEDRFPESVATVGHQGVWNWSEPTILNGYYSQTDPRLHRSMSAYLNGYITEADILQCPNAPREIKYLEEAWAAGDLWDNPETGEPDDPLSGNYCFYWGYTGYLEGGRLFRGPRTAAGERGYSQLLVGDYFGYDHWRSLKSFGSCEPFARAGITAGTMHSASYWSCRDDKVSLESITVRPQAGYVDGRVEVYMPQETTGMRAILDRALNLPYPDGIGPGVYYIPRVAH